jgi:hypothetical protein
VIPPSAAGKWWKSDGAEAGTVMVMDIRPGTNSGGPDFFVPAGGNMVFVVTDNQYGQELWFIKGISGEFDWPMFLPAIVNSGKKK